MQEMLSLNSSVRYLKGVGPKICKLLNSIGIYTLWDLLYYFPARYEDRSNLKPINKLRPDTTETIKGKVVSANLRRSRKRRGMVIFQAAIKDKTGTVYAIWFNQPYLSKYVKKGVSLILHGKVEKSSHLLQFMSPEYEIVRQGSDSIIHTGRIVPIYRLTKDLNQRRLRSIAYNAVRLTKKIEEFIPSFILNNMKLVSLADALEQIHFPVNKNKYLKARKRLVFDEFFILQILVAFKKVNLTKQNSAIFHNIDRALLQKLEELLEFKLTLAQKKVIDEIISDMHQDRVMNRLLQGDVGSGKTAVSMFASLISLSNDYQVAFMVPTEILALQHYAKFKKIFSKLGFNVGLLISSLNPDEDKKVREDIESGNLDLVIGTHSLIQDKVNFINLGLCVIDEQHRFGVWQRARLHNKGRNPDVLVMTATPIPRTLTMTLYGDMDISIINQLPPGRKLAKTYWIDTDKKKESYSFIKKKIRQGRQCYIVYPLIDDSDKMDLKAATNMHKELKENIFKDFKVGLLHGKISSEERDMILASFMKNEINILVTTLVIEVGIDIPNASILMVENAERFGLSQLHQLRGRITRAGFQPYCILVSDSKTLEAKQRLDMLVATADGFKISESDLILRGSGEFIGAKQHGFAEFKIADLLKDTKILIQARNQAFKIIKTSPELKEDIYKNLRKKINLKYKRKDLEFIGA